eukprot:1016276-Amphidinium_carterae.1
MHASEGFGLSGRRTCGTQHHACQLFHANTSEIAVPPHVFNASTCRAFMLARTNGELLSIFYIAYSAIHIKTPPGFPLALHSSYLNTDKEHSTRPLTSETKQSHKAMVIDVSTRAWPASTSN